MIDNLDYARSFRETRATITGCDFSRLAEAAVDLAGDVVYALQGLIDEQGRSVLILHVQATVNLLCQRCLEEFQQQIDQTDKFVVLQSEAEIVAIEVAQEDSGLHEDEAQNSGWQEDYLVYSDRFDVLALIEDALLLSIPYSPRHLQGSCSVPVGASSRDGPNVLEKPNPFAVLATLRVGKAEDWQE